MYTFCSRSAIVLFAPNSAAKTFSSRRSGTDPCRWSR
jgi:hypothetical protein